MAKYYGDIAKAAKGARVNAVWGDSDARWEGWRVMTSGRSRDGRGTDGRGTREAEV